MVSRFKDKVCVQCGKEWNTGGSDCFLCGSDLIDIGAIPYNAVKTEEVARLTNAMMCVNCNRIMTMDASDKGICPKCNSMAVYPALPGHVVDAPDVPDVRRVG